MKLKLALASASVLVLSACGTSQDALQALQSMQILENNAGAAISYEKLSGSGNDVTLSNVTFRAPADAMAGMMPPAQGEGPLDALKPGAPPMALATAQSLKLSGLTMKNGKPMARDIVVSNVTPAVPMGDATLTIGSIGVQGMNEATGTFIASAFTKEGPGPAPAFEQWAFGKASVNGVTVSGKIPQEEEGATPGVVNVQLGELSFSNLSNRTLGLARVSGIKGDLDIPGMPAVKGAFDLGTFDVEKFRLGMYADLISVVMASMEPGAEKPDFAKALAGYTSPLETGYDVARWTGAKVDVSGLKFDASQTEARLTRNADGVAVAMDSPRYSMTFTADSAGGALGAMGMMGLAIVGLPSNAVEIYGEQHATFDPAKDLTRWTNYNVGVTDVFDVKASGGVLGVEQAMPALVAGMIGVIQAAAKAEADADAPADDGEDADAHDHDDGDDADADDDASGDADDAFPSAEEGIASAMQSPEVTQAAMQMVFGLMSLQLTDLDLSITDKKLVELILTQQAMESGQSVAATRLDLSNMVAGSAELMTGVGVDPAIANEATAAIAGFLSGPGTLRIQLKPKSPIGAMSLMLSPTKESLGFSATFTPAGT
jgi:hypothetical protein